MYGIDSISGKRMGKSRHRCFECFKDFLNIFNLNLLRIHWKHNFFEENLYFSVSFGDINMPKNKGKGGKNRRRGKNENEAEKRELVFREDGQVYAQVVKMLGNGRLEALCFDGVKRLCHIRGKLRKKVWINQGDIILLGLRDFQDAKADVILKYNPDEARNLKAYGELPEHAKINDTVTFGEEEEDDNIIEFDEVDGEEDIENI